LARKLCQAWFGTNIKNQNDKSKFENEGKGRSLSGLHWMPASGEMIFAFLPVTLIFYL